MYVWILTFDENSIVAAEGTFDFDLELKKRSSVESILDKNRYTFYWISAQSDWHASSSEFTVYALNFCLL